MCYLFTLTPDPPSISLPIIILPLFINSPNQPAMPVKGNSNSAILVGWKIL